MQDQLSQETTEMRVADAQQLQNAITHIVYDALPPSVATPWEETDERDREEALGITNAITKRMEELGWIVPGVPPLTRVLADFKKSHDKLTLTTLALRILNMLAFSDIQTPESKPARKFIDDYLAGVNHGPAGEPMLWPGRLPGLANLLREWGYVPTIALPGQPSFVAKALPPVQVQ